MTRQGRAFRINLLAAVAALAAFAQCGSASAFSTLNIDTNFVPSASTTVLSLDMAPTVTTGGFDDELHLWRGTRFGSDVVYIEIGSPFFPPSATPSSCTATGWVAGLPDYYCEVSGSLALNVLTNDGRDNIKIGASPDTAASVQSGDGEDIIQTENFEGKSTINGGPDKDIISGGPGDGVLLGDRGDDIIAGGSGSEKIFGASGNDFIQAGDGNDSIFGGADDDTINGEGGNDTLYGDFLTGNSPGDDTIVGGTGVDVVVYSDRTAPVTVKNNNSDSGEAGEKDKIGESVENATTGPGDDNITMVGEDPNSVSSGAGNDIVNVENGFGDHPGVNTVDCGDGDADTVTANWDLDVATVTNCELGVPTTEAQTVTESAATVAAVVDSVFTSPTETASVNNPKLSWSGKRSLKLQAKRRATVAKLSPVVYLKASESLTAKIRIRAVVKGKKLTLYSKTKQLSANKRKAISVKTILGAKKLSSKVKKIRKAVLAGLKRRGKKVKFIFTATGMTSDGRKAVSATRTVTVTRKKR